MFTREEMIAAGKRAVEAGDIEAANEIADAIASRDAVQQRAPHTPKAPKQSGIDKFATGLTRLPQLVELGKRGDEARGKFAGGAAGSVVATARSATDVLGPVDDWVIGGVREGLESVGAVEDTGDFGQHVKRSKQLAEELREDKPLASALGDVMGFGYAGKALRSVGAARGAKIGVAGEAAAVTGAHSLAEGEGVEKAAQDALFAAALGKVFEVGLNRAVKPVAENVLPKIGRTIDRIRGKGGSDEFKIPEADIQRIANRLKLPADEVRANLDEYIKAKGVTPDLLSIVNRETAEEFEKLSRKRKGAGDVFRQGEEDSLRALPDRVAGSVRRTGDTATASEVEGAVTAQADEAAAQAARRTEDEVIETTDIVTGQQRMERANTEAATALQEKNISDAATALSARLQKAGEGIDAPENVDEALREYTTALLRREGGLGDRPVTLSSNWIKTNLPEDPTDVAKILTAKAKTMVAGPDRDLLVKAAEDLGTGADVTLDLSAVDVMRRVLSKGGTDANGVKYNLGEAARNLTKEAARQHPDFADKYLKVFAGTKRGLAARQVTDFILGKKAAQGAATIEGRVARANAADSTGEAAVWIKEGARDGALNAIAAASKDGAQALKSAASILRNADEIVRVAGADGERVVSAVRRTMSNVQKIREELADIALRARTGKEELSDALKKRVIELKRAGKAQVDAIKATLDRDKKAIDAAAKILSTTESEFAAATAGSTQNLGSVARGAIAGKAAQSPADAIRVVEDLATPATQRRVGRVAGQQTADTLGDVGRVTRREIENKNVAAARTEKQGPLSDEISVALEAAASLSGRAGPGYIGAVVKRALDVLQYTGISKRAAKSLAQAVLRQDEKYIRNVLNRVAKTERQRKVIETALKAWATGLAAGNITEAR